MRRSVICFGNKVLNTVKISQDTEVYKLKNANHSNIQRRIT